MKPIEKLLLPGLGKTVSTDELIKEIAKRKTLSHKVLHTGPWEALYSPEEWAHGSMLMDEIEKLEDEVYRRNVLEPYADRKEKIRAEILGSIGGNAAHAEHRTEAEKAIKYYDEHRPEFKSTRKLAKHISRDKGEGIVDLTFRVIYEKLLLPYIKKNKKT